MMNRFVKPFGTVLIGLLLFFALMGLNHPAHSVFANPKIVINIPSRTLWLYAGDHIVREYNVGVGQSNFPTPIGEFKVLDKVLEPVFEDPFLAKGQRQIAPGAHNPLGTRWIGFKQANGGEYGIHGTYDLNSVGQFSTHGCIRMSVHDAEELFDSVDINTPIEVVYELVLIEPHEDSLKVLIFPDLFHHGLPSAGLVRRKILEKFPNAQVNEETIATALTKATQTALSVSKPAEPDEAIPGNGYFKLRISY